MQTSGTNSTCHPEERDPSDDEIAAVMVTVTVHEHERRLGHRLVEQLDADRPGATAWREFLVACADAAARCWRETDQGIWEVRGEPRNFLYSKLMCWVALDRAIAMAAMLRAEDRVPEWRTAAAAVREEILTRGWSDTATSFTQSLGTPDLDASLHVLAGTGAGRFRAVDRARAVFERAVSHADDVGLLAEEVDPATGDLLGNFPQALSHIGLVNAAWAISCAG